MRPVARGIAGGLLLSLVVVAGLAFLGTRAFPYSCGGGDSVS